MRYPNVTFSYHHRRRNGFESVGHNLPARSAGEIFFTVPLPLLACAPLVGGHSWALGWAILKKLGLPLPHKYYGP